MNNLSFPTNDDHSPLWLNEPAEYELELELDDDLTQDLFLPEDSTLEEHLAVEGLLDEGFSWEESLGLLRLRMRIFENPETQEHPRMQFARWLYQHGHLSETLD